MKGFAGDRTTILVVINVAEIPSFPIALVEVPHTEVQLNSRKLSRNTLKVL
jgi:hypothetical protein